MSDARSASHPEPPRTDVDLDDLYASPAAWLASSPDGDGWDDGDDPALFRSIFRRGDLPGPPEVLTARRLALRRGSHGYLSVAVDWVQLSASAHTYRCMGLWIVACLLEPGPRSFELRLTNPRSEIRRLRTSTEHRSLRTERPGLHTEPHAVVYFPRRRPRYPLHGAEGPLPYLLLTDEEELATCYDGDSRDTVVGFGSDEGAWKFAELLLDFGQSWNERDEADLEGPYGGFGGVEPDSAEVRLYLPGAIGWELEEAGPA